MSTGVTSAVEERADREQQALASGAITTFAGAGVKIGWRAASWLLDTIGLYGSGKK